MLGREAQSGSMRASIRAQHTISQLDEAATPPVVLAPCRERLETLSDAVIDSVVC